MGKDNKLLWLIGGAIAAYALIPEKVREALPGGGGGLGATFNIRDLLGGVQFPELTMPEFNIPEFSFPEISELEIPLILEIPSIPEIIDLIPPIPETPTIPGFPDLVPTVIPDITPENPIGIIEDLQAAVTRAGGIAGRQYAGAILTGTHLIRPLPLAREIELVTAPLRIGARAISTRTMPKVAGVTFPRMWTKLAPELFPRVGTKVLATAGLKTGARLGARAIPFAGWALLVADVGADIARLFGADVTEWLGISALAEPFLGYNPIERFVGAGTVDAKVTQQEKTTIQTEAGVKPESGYQVSEWQPPSEKQVREYEAPSWVKGGMAYL